jgi:hypothetical protein
MEFVVSDKSEGNEQKICRIIKKRVEVVFLLWRVERGVSIRWQWSRWMSEENVELRREET